ncbi:adhesion G-protein coupled receptor G2-like [Hippoglossus hippoglossus]|uniref:adhesion G-protein coupled receptor G2-like n=1 Tax=Hippoglossus hippoglossus TaxID=8267 RepID=UPI00148E044F|nr:adhesion G-protein coupled receptor G2-like [Hippoglossus hippoglossus]
MLHGNEDKVNVPRICSGGSSCCQTYAVSVRMRNPGSRVRHLHWLQILLVVLLTGETSCNSTSAAPFSPLTPSTAAAPTSASYFLHVTVDVIGQKKNESEIKSWLDKVFTAKMVGCVSSNETTPTTTAAASQNYTTTTATTQTTSASTSNKTTPMTTATSQNYTTTATTQTTSASTSNKTTPMTTAAATSQNYTTTATTQTTSASTSNETTPTTTAAATSQNYTTFATASTTVKSTNTATTSQSIMAAPITSSTVTTKKPKKQNPNPNSNKGPVAAASCLNLLFRRLRRTTGLFQGTEVSCSQKTAIKNTTCTVTLHLSQAVPPCCILRILCAASKTSPDVRVVGKTADRIGPMQNGCNPLEKNRCIYNGPGSASCERSSDAYVKDQGNSTICRPVSEIEKNCSCSAYCNKADAYYTFQIFIQSPKVNNSYVYSKVSKIQAAPICSPATEFPCPWSLMSSGYNHTKQMIIYINYIQSLEMTKIDISTQDVQLICESTGASLQSCKVIVSFAREVPICNVSAAVTNRFASNEHISFNGQVTRVAICGNSNASEDPLMSQFTWEKSSLKPATFCKATEESVNLTCQNGKNVVVELDERCDGPNVTTVQPNTTTTVNATSSPLNTTAEPLSNTTTTANVTVTTTLNNTTTTANVTVTTVNTTTTTPNVTVTTTLNNTTTTANVTVTTVNTTTTTPNVTVTTTLNNTTTTANVTVTTVNTTTTTPNVTVTTTLNNTTTTPNVTVTTTLNTTTTTPNVTVTTLNNTTTTPNVTVTTTLNTTTSANVTVTTTLNTTTTTPNVTVTTTLNTTTTTTTPNVTVTTTLNTITTTPNVTVTTTPNATTTTTNVNTTESAERQADALLELTRNVANLNSSQVDQLVSQLQDLLSGPTVSLALGNSSVHIVSNLLGASAETLADSSSRIIDIIDTVGLKLVLDDQAETLLASAVALSVKPADGSNFQETFFSISDPTNVLVRGDPRSRRSVRADSSIPQGSIRLPPTLTQDLTTEQQQLASRVQFNFYQKSTVFQDRSLGERKLNSGILGASVANLSITGLKDNVVIHLRNKEPIPDDFKAVCVFWDFAFNNGSGGWNESGCSVLNSTDNMTTCGCNHLTSFAILLDLSRQHLTDPLQATILTFITYIGCGISAIFLSITLLTYLAFGKLRKDIPSKILIQLCLALLLLNLVFLIDAWLALYPEAVGLCISTAWFLHYFLLVSFTWMGLESVHMYLALVKVFNNYISHYMLRFSFAGWGIPMIVVIIVIAVDKDNYGLVSYGKFPDRPPDSFCWLKNDTAFYVAVVAYFCAVFLFNVAMFVVVLVQLCRIKRQNPHNMQHRTTLQDVRSLVGITILLGLTWGFAFFAWGPVNLAFMYLFAIFNSLQGFFIFVFHCAVKENVRRQWRMYLCCGKMRLAENSEWSRNATQKTTKRSSVTRLTSLHSSQSSQSNNSSSSSFLVHNTPQPTTEPTQGIGSPFEDRTITADEEPNMDVVLNEINRQYRAQQAS